MSSLRLSAFGAQISFHEAHALARFLVKSTRRTKCRTKQTENTSGECTTAKDPTTSTTSTDSTWTKPTGCDTSMRPLILKVKTWLRAKLASKFTSTQWNQFYPTRSSWSGIVKNSHRDLITLSQDNWWFKRSVSTEKHTLVHAHLYRALELWSEWQLTRSVKNVST